MTATQALVALILFAPGVLAPPLGLRIADISLFSTTVFAVGVATSLYGGVMADRIGACRVAAFCAAAVAAGAVLAASGTPALLVVAGLVVGLAFGPETPASSSLLGRLARPEQRPLVFSVRQCGNQIGAISGSLLLPLLALLAPRAGFAVIALIAIILVFVLLRLSKRYDQGAGQAAAPVSLAASTRLIIGDRGLLSLALLAVPYSAMQMALNTYLVSLAAGTLGYSHVHAGLLLGLAQVGGLVGRLLWGLVASKLVQARTILLGLGFAMAFAALMLGLAGSQLPPLVLAVLVFFLGLTASGWNGVFLAEVARLAPPERTAEATGGVLTAGYVGLLLAPLLVSSTSAAFDLAASYTALGVIAAAATIFVWMRHNG